MEIRIDAGRLMYRKAAFAYMQEIFGLEEQPGNLDALYDDLSEVSKDVTLILDPVQTTRICKDAYAFRLLRVLGKAADGNPHIHLCFREEEPQTEENKD